MSLIGSLVLVVAAQPALSPEQALDAIAAETDPAALYGKLKERSIAARTAQTGTGYAGVQDIATEAVQILGQIVVDRASQAAFELIRDKLTEWLGCEEATAVPHTCGVLAALRIQDIAASPRALAEALLLDVLELEPIKKVLSLGDGKVAELLSPVLKTVMKDLVRRAIRERGSPSLDTLAEVGLEQIVAAGWKVLENGNGQLPATDKEGRALVYAVLAIKKCRGLADRFSRLSDCPVAEFTSELLAKEAEAATVTKAVSLAVEMLHGLALPAKTHEQALARATITTEILFDVAAMMVPEQKDTLARVRALIEAAIAGDGPGFVAAAAKIAVAEIEKVLPKSGRAFELFGALIQYADTYGTAPAEGEDPHDARQKILESLTEQMTQRTGREGDAIWSLGGSLRARGGVRLNPGTPVPSPVVSLVLGIGFDTLGEKDGDPGWHLELAPIDLGEYLAFEDTSEGGYQLEVKEPRPESLLAPSFTLGIGWGSSVRFYLALTAVYSPSYRRSVAGTDEKSWGAVDVGLVGGAYVPLFDID